ncbi:uncharacterized protein PV09_05344 [Verruconis gallopava]|uniref:Uncharacterized protein n=1 Tax=Verruconis gallopava TaxID=253628 RepID=A0A0D2AAJ8_9PEZI|nr:uncharacterized protein PV09_05344 [Verruconis gallopava]KIW03590.1 hypothetical protein PV09_05344 [Verruconis gallopava]
MGSMPEANVDVDVLIVGGGPVGLNLAYQLRRFSIGSGAKPISVHIIEALPKPKQETFGRAVTFWPRSVELLAQLGLAPQLLQKCFAVRSSASYDGNGNEVFNRGWSFLEGISDTRYRFATVLRQKYVEDLFRAKIQQLGVTVMENHRFVDLKVIDSVPVGGMGRVKARIVVKDDHIEREYEYSVRCRYLIGCDGSRTTVRKAAGIDSEGSRTEDKWVRVDGVLKSTTMPKPTSYGSLESPIYGNVLWIPLDHGATRIGFCLKEERRKLYGSNVGDREVFIREAELSVAPFKIEFERVDWASVYSVGQRLACSFWAKESVFLAGDAAHSHSSGAGQGMNTGVQDAVNLGWKLAMVLTGTLKREVLSTYNDERWRNADRLIKYDKDISSLIGGRLPVGWTGSKDPNVALAEIFKEATGFNTGLTIGYDPNIAIWRDDRESELGRHGQKSAHTSTSVIPAPAIPGYRAPDVQLLLPALRQPCWLHDLTPNVARFFILTFLGSIAESNLVRYRSFKSALQLNSKLDLSAQAELGRNVDIEQCIRGSCAEYWPVCCITVLPYEVDNAWTALGTDPIGSVYHDTIDRGAARRWGVDDDSGAVFILRPDGFIGASFSLHTETAISVAHYLEGLFT